MDAHIFRNPTRPISPGRATGSVVVLWLPYTLVEALYQAGHLHEAAALGLQGALAVLALGVLAGAGCTRRDCFLRLAPLSQPGLVVLAISFLLPAMVLLAGRWTGWNPLAALVYAPVSTITQELFFRSALLPALLLVLSQRPSLALVVHAVLFGLWHVGPVVLGAPLWGVLAVMLMPLLCGLAWGWQARRDQTIVGVLVVHLALLVLTSFITWG